MKSPFKFLDSYTKDDREIFFGRDREIEELYQKVFDSKLLLVYGVSGTGKSSLIHCGLANKFSETDWLPLVIRRGGNIIESMASEIKGAAITQQNNNFQSPADFKKGVKSLYLDHYKPVFFIFDQFEELFIFGGKEERRAFVHIVKTLIESDLQCRFIFVMREEYMAWITEFEKVIPTFFSNRVRIEKMSHRNALDAIEEPCKIFNISLEEGFAETLLEKLSPGSEEVELTYLQVFLDKIFRIALEVKQAQVDNEHLLFNLAMLNKVGNVSDLLGSFLDDQIALMEDPESAMAVLKAFVSGKGTKRPASESEAIDNINSFGKGLSAIKVKEQIQTFVRLRVLRDKDDNDRYELRHDSLAEKIFEKFSLAEKELLEIRQMIENSYQYYLKRKILLSSDDLSYISNKDSLLNLNIELQSFLAESRKHQLAKVRTVKRLTAISAFVFLLLIMILAYFITNKLAGVSSNYTAIRSMSQTKNSKERLILAISAWNQSEGVLPKQALISVFNDIINSEEPDTSIKINKSLFKITFEKAPAEIRWANCSKDNRYIYGFCDSLIVIWEISGKIYRTIKYDHKIIDLKMSEESKYLGAVGSDSLLSIFDILGNKLFSYKTHYNKLNTKQIFRFSDQDKILTISSDHDAVLLGNDGTLLQTFDHHTGQVNAVDITAKSSFIATASSDKTIVIWQADSLKKDYKYYNTLTWHSDTVWSISFSKINSALLSASSDSSIIVGSINNEILSYDEFFPTEKKYCFVEFTPSARGITALRYEDNIKEHSNLFLASHADNPTCSRYGFNKMMIRGQGGIELSYISFSPDEEYFIYQQLNSTYLADNRLVFEMDYSTPANLMKIDGSEQFFTSDGKYILSIAGLTFKTYFINIDDIARQFTGEE